MKQINKDVPPSCLNSFNSLSEKKKSYLLERYKNEKKELAIALVAWFFCLHDPYLGKKFRFLYFITAGWFGIGWMINLFKIKSLLNQANEEVFEKILASVIV